MLYICFDAALAAFSGRGGPARNSNYGLSNKNTSGPWQRPADAVAPLETTIMVFLTKTRAAYSKKYVFIKPLPLTSTSSLEP